MSPQQNNGPMSEKDQAILKAYGVLNALHAVNTHQPEGVKKPVLINDILAYIQGRTTSGTKRVEVALNNDLTVRRQYKQLLRVKQVEHIAKPRAAHSDDVFEKRIGEQGVLLKLKQSKGNDEQYYLIIELPDAISVQSDKPLVLHANTESQTQRAVFPPVHDGRSQIILNKNDVLFSLLQDHDVEIDIQ